VSFASFTQNVTAPVRRALLDLDRRIRNGPQGLVAWKLGTLDNAATSGTPIDVYTLTAPLVAGRAYILEWTVRAMLIGANQNYYFTVVESPTIPNVFGDFYVNANSGGGYASSTWSVLVQPTTTDTYTFTVKATSGSGGAIYANGDTIRLTDIGRAVAGQ
jgi:hypothetical protein